MYLPTKLIIFIFILASCKKLNTNNFASELINKTMLRHNIIRNDYILIAIANDDCHDCGNFILNHNNKLGENTFIIFDTLNYNIPPISIGKNLIKVDNDSMARINVNDDFGHRIFYIKHNKIIRVKNINTTNVDSIF